MRAVSGEDHAVVHETLEPPALEGVDGHPVDLEIGAAEHPLMRGLTFSGRFSISGSASQPSCKSIR